MPTRTPRREVDIDISSLWATVERTRRSCDPFTLPAFRASVNAQRGGRWCRRARTRANLARSTRKAASGSRAACPRRAVQLIDSPLRELSSRYAQINLDHDAGPGRTDY